MVYVWPCGQCSVYVYKYTVFIIGTDAMNKSDITCDNCNRVHTLQPVIFSTVGSLLAVVLIVVLVITAVCTQRKCKRMKVQKKNILGSS